MHEMGYYDLPSTIDYILNKTNQDKLYYVGHSQGTSDFMVMASTRPEYNEKIALSILLAPVVYMDSISSSFAQIGGKMQTMLRVRSNRITNAKYYFKKFHRLLSRQWVNTSFYPIPNF